MLKDYKNLASRSKFVSQKIFCCCYFSRNFIAIHEIKPVLTLNKPIYRGFSILDLCKFLMDNFHYNYMTVKHDCGAKLFFFTVIDSLVYEIETNVMYEDFYGNKNLFDFSDYPKNSQFYDPVHKKVIG